VEAMAGENDTVGSNSDFGTQEGGSAGTCDSEGRL
jgi:hypothetical protein